LQGDDLATLQAAMKKLVTQHPELLDHAIVSPHLPGTGVQSFEADAKEWMRIATHPGIADLVEQIIGPDIILWGSTVFYKKPLKGPETAWHRDGQVWPIEPLETTSVWIAASESTRENGCLRVIPGSHTQRKVGEHVFEDRTDMIVRRSLSKTEFDESQAVDVELEAGQMVIFDVYTVHGGRHNTGTKERAGYSLRFMPATSHFNHQAAKHRDEPGYAHETRALIQIRGVDRSGKNDFTRGFQSTAG
jgi:ectoine hydroxylase-related dioxygenase (phytanoyl-CoA dioxygenase family)